MTGLIFLTLMVPAMRERQKDYALNAWWMERTRKALDTDEDAHTILSTLAALPPSRTYAGRRRPWVASAI